MAGRPASRVLTPACLRAGIVSAILLAALFGPPPAAAAGARQDGAGGVHGANSPAAMQPEAGIGPAAVIVLFGVFLLALAALWTREQSLSGQTRKIRLVYKLGEALAAGRSVTDNLRLLRSTLPRLLNVSDAQIYLAEPASGLLHPVQAGPSDGAGAGEGFSERVLNLCYRNRSLIAIPDVRRSPFHEQGRRLPRAAMLAPMFAQDEVIGVLVLRHDRRVRRFSSHEQAIAQHLANQTAINLRILERKALEERMTGRGRFEAVCRLASAAAQETAQSLSRVAEELSPAGGRGEAATPPDAWLAAELRSSAATLEQIAGMTALDGAPQAVDLKKITTEVLAELRKRPGAAGAAWELILPKEQISVATASPALLEQVLRSLLLHIESRLKKDSAGAIRLRLSRLAKGAQLDISVAGASRTLRESESLSGRLRGGTAGRLSLNVCRSFLRTLGGELRLVQGDEGDWRLEIEFPQVQADAQDAGDLAVPVKSMTILVVQPDSAAQRALLALLADLGQRAVPAANIEEAREAAQRLRFDMVICSAELGGDSWLECFQKLRGQAPVFVALTSGGDASGASLLPREEVYTLAQPVQAEDARRLLAAVASREERGGG